MTGSSFVVSLNASFHTSVQLLLESLFNGVAIGSVLLMAALGLAIVFGLMGVINLAHGELIMLGAYTTTPTCWWRFRWPSLSAAWSASCWNAP